MHTTGAVASTFHQRLKFIYENQLITIMVEEPMTIFHEKSIPYIDGNAFSEVSFHSFELVSRIHNASEPESSWLATIMMAIKEMLKFGYKLGQGLEVLGRGSPTLIEHLDNKGRLGLGYEPTHEEVFQASRGKKRKCTTLGMLTPYIRATFPTLAEVIMPKPFKELEYEELDLTYFIWLCPEEFSMNAITSFEDDPASTI